MKECKYCRSMYDDNLTACPNCGGNKIITAEDRAEEAGLRQKEIENREKAIEAPVRQRKTIIGVIAAVVVVVVAIVGIVSFNANKPLSNGMTQDQGDAVLAEGIAYYESGEYEKAMECLIQLPSDSKQYEEAQEIIRNSTVEYKAEILAKADQYMQNEEYEVALALLDKAKTLLPDDDELNSKYNSCYGTYKKEICSAAIADANMYALSNDYPSAINTLNNAIAIVGNDAELEAKLTSYMSEYKNIILNSAATSLVSSGYQEAISILQNSLSVLQNDADLLAAIEEYKTYAPIELFEMETFSGNNNPDRVSAVTDTYGNEYAHAYIVSTNYGTDEFTLLLNGEYSNLSGTIVWSKEEKNNSGYYFIMFYDGDTLIYTTPNCSAESGPIEFSCNISGVQKLTVKFDAFSTDGPFDQNIVSLTVSK